MDSIDVNKAVAAVLVAGIAFMVTGLIAGGLVREEPLAKSVLNIEGATPAAATAAAKPAGPAPIEPLLASADPAKGEADTKKLCAACHSFNEGGKAGVGPNLYGVLGAPHGHMAGFNYSTALKSKKGPWTYAELNEWLYKPSAYAPGTHMTFAGEPNDKIRADIIAYIRTLSPNPEPLPKVEAAPAATAAAAPAAAPAAGGAPAATPAAANTSFDKMLVAADPKAGEADTKKYCTTCHTFGKGEKAGFGPNLWGVVGAPHGHMVGYDYTAGMKAKKGPWTFDELNTWLTNPAAYVPGTRMIFPGLKSEKQRADIIAYLRTLSDNPVPLPTVK